MKKSILCIVLFCLLVTMTACKKEKEVVSIFTYSRGADNFNTGIFYTVPEEKTFVITDIIADSDSLIRLYINGDITGEIGFPDDRTTISLRSGIVFAGGSEVSASTRSFTTIIFSGYLY